MRKALQTSSRPQRVGHRPPLTHQIGGVGLWNTPPEYWQGPGPVLEFLRFLTDEDSSSSIKREARKRSIEDGTIV